MESISSHSYRYCFEQVGDFFFSLVLHLFLTNSVCIGACNIFFFWKGDWDIMNSIFTCAKAVMSSSLIKMWIDSLKNQTLHFFLQAVQYSLVHLVDILYNIVTTNTRLDCLFLAAGKDILKVTNQMGSLGSPAVKKPPANSRDGYDPCVI